MLRKVTVFGLTMALALLGAAAVAQDGGDLTLDQVIAKNIEAKGGEEKVRAIKTVSIEGTMMMGPGMEAPLTWIWMYPDKMRMSFEVQGMEGVQAFDGKTAWMVMPFMGKTEPEEMTAEQTQNLREESDWQGPLLDYEKKGYQVELLGKEDVEGTEAYKIKVTYGSGSVGYMYLDAEYFLEIKQESKRKIQGQEIEVVQTVSDYKEVDGIMVAHSRTIMPKGAPAGQTITFTTVQFNPDVDESIFSMPQGGTEEAGE
jgi:outer membrane lipoprotein-sorting protein